MQAMQTSRLHHFSLSPQSTSVRVSPAGHLSSCPKVTRRFCPSMVQSAFKVQSVRPVQATSEQSGIVLPTVLINNPIAQQLSKVVGTPIFLAFEVVALLVLLALTDAAYSGDWSRIGVISKEMEPVLQKLAIVAWSLHVGTGALAANIAKGKGRSASAAAVKGFLFGALHVFEQAMLPAVKDDQQ